MQPFPNYQKIMQTEPTPKPEKQPDQTTDLEGVASTDLLAEPCSSCGKKSVQIPGDVYGLCDDCSDIYMSNLSRMLEDDESTRGLVG
jgi:hypothetical protein